MLTWLARKVDRTPLTVVLLLALFVVSFTAPIFFALKLGRIFTRQDAVVVDRDLFKDAVHIPGSGNYIKIQSSEFLNPQVGEDFLLVFWFKLARLPQLEERMVLVSKYEAETQHRPGYSLALHRDGDSVRPVVYWQNAEGAGNWYTFSEMQLPPKSWAMLALSFKDNSLLGMHAAIPDGGGSYELKLMGGYDVGSGVIPASQSDLIIGALNASKFKGMVGPIAIFSGKRLSKDLRSILQDIVKDPQTLPADVEKEEVKFLSINGESDLSSNQHRIELVLGPGGRKGGKGKGDSEDDRETLARRRQPGYS